MMRWLKNLGFRLRSLVSRRRFDAELDEEFAFHLDMEARKHEAAGMSPDAALREARLRFGGEDRFREHARDSWGVRAVTDVLADIRFAVRQFRRTPGLTAVAIGTLALGIGGTVSLFSVVHGLLLRPLPYPDEDQVMVFWSEYDWRGSEFDHVRELPAGFAEIAAYSSEAYTLQTERGTSMILTTVASAELFTVLGAPPLLGRTFREGDDRPGAEPVIVLTWGLWQSEFGGEESVLGRRVNVSGVLRTVVGVMPREFYFTSPAMRAFIPLDLDPAAPAYANSGWLVLMGRVHAGVTASQTQDDLAIITQALGERFEYPERWDKTRNASVIPIRESLMGDVRPALLALLGAVSLLLLLACVNVAALLLTRTVDRTREIAVRSALGAGRGRLSRQILTESLVLGVTAGAAGLGLASVLFETVVASLPVDEAFRGTLALDWSALVSALAISTAVGCLVALAPMRGLLRGRALPAAGLGDRSGGAAAAHAGRLQGALVVVEAVLAVVLLSGATLLVRTVDALRSLDPGFEPHGVLAVGLVVSADETVPGERARFFDALRERARQLPGVTHAGFTNRLPLRDGGYQGPVRMDDRPDLDGAQRPNALYRPVDPEVFEALGMRVVRGRGILPGDRGEGPQVAVINETFARRIWGDADPIGRTYESGFHGAVEVVGVVEDVAIIDLVDPPPMAGFYPWDQSLRGAEFGILVLRADVDPASLMEPVRRLVQELEPRSAVSRMQTMEQVVDAALAEPLRLRFFLGLFGLLGLVLGAVGVYGVVSYSVQRRRAEHGIRLALGAAPPRLLRDVLRRALGPVLAGVVAGLVVALLGARVLSGFLFGVTPSDPTSLGFAAAALLGAALVAALVPALRASATPPAEALRTE